jgi:hypothetical protein
MILTYEEVQNIKALGLEIWLADPTRERVYLWTAFSINKGAGGIFLSGGSGDRVYLEWLGITDPTNTKRPPYNDDLRIFDNKEEAADYLIQILKQRGVKVDSQS